MADHGSFTITGGKELAEQLKKLSPGVRAKVTKSGLRRAANRVRTNLRRAAPKQSGRLRESIKVKLGRYGRAWVGLRQRYYYKTLELDSARGAPLHPFFLAAWDAMEKEIAQMIIDSTRQELIKAAGRAYARLNFRK